MIVHNPVVGDARVRKEAKSISDAGYDVDLYGYGTPTTVARIENTRLKIIEKTPMISALSILIRLTQKAVTRLIARDSSAAGLTWDFWLSYASVIVSFALLQLGKIDNYNMLLVVLIAQTISLVSKLEFNTSLTNFITTNTSVFFVVSLLAASYKLFFYYTIFMIAGGITLFGLVALNRFGILDKILYRHSLPATYRHIARKLASAVKAENYDVVHVHDTIALLAAEKLKNKNSSLKIIWDAHEIYPEISYKTGNGQRFMYKIIAKASSKIDHFITINESIADYYSKNFPKLPEATILMNAARKVDNIESKVSPLRERTGISASQFVLLFQGGLGVDRGIDILLQAAYSLPKNWSIVFMGKGVMVPEIERTIAKLNVSREADRPAISLIPPAPYDELAEWTSGADLGIIPYENMNLNFLYCTPNKLWEYPNASVPILASGMVEMSKMISKYKTGILMPENFSETDILEVLKKLDRSSLDVMVEKCREFNKVEHWEKYEVRLRDLYLKIAS